jgi:hypothetical protein
MPDRKAWVLNRNSQMLDRNTRMLDREVRLLGVDNLSFPNTYALRWVRG